MWKGLLLFSLLTALSGCGKKPAVSPAAEGAAATNRVTGPLAGEVNGFLTEQLHVFVQEKGRLPNDFAELSRTKLDSVPRAPRGAKWTIDPITQEVKAVQQ